MATTTATWTENQTLRSAATLAQGGTDTNDIDLDTNGYDCVVIQTDITHDSSTGVTVEVFASPDSGTTDDDTPIMSYSTDGTDEVRSLTIFAVPYIAVKITNDDGSNVTGNIAQIYAGRKWDTT